MTHPHKAIMQAWANNTNLKIEWRDSQGIRSWMACTHPSFSPELQYRIALHGSVDHVALVHQFSNDPTLEFQKRGDDGSWIDIWTGVMHWGSDEVYRIKPKPRRMQIGDMMSSKTTSLMVIVTSPPTEDEPSLFSGVVVRSSNLTMTGQLDDDWMVDAFTRVENTLENP